MKIFAAVATLLLISIPFSQGGGLAFVAGYLISILALTTLPALVVIFLYRKIRKTSQPSYLATYSWVTFIISLGLTLMPMAMSSY